MLPIFSSYMPSCMRAGTLNLTASLPFEAPVSCEIMSLVKNSEELLFSCFLLNMSAVFGRCSLCALFSIWN